MNSTNDIIVELTHTLSKKRQEHCISTSQYAILLAARYHHQFLETHKEDIINASLFHDTCREWNESALTHYISIHCVKIEEEEIHFPILLHAPVAATIMSEYEFLNKEYMKSAVRWHSLGSKEMGILGALLYCADFMEPKRVYLSDEKRTSLLTSASLEELTLRVVSLHMKHMKENGKEVATSTTDLYQFLMKNGTFR